MPLRSQVAESRSGAVGSLALACIALLLSACGAAPDVDLVDPQATDETKALFANLQRISDEAVLFGHQDDLAYGVEWWAEPGGSDVKAVAGSYPAVYGWDVGDLGHGAAVNLDSVRFDQMRDWIRGGYERGGVITISWHMDNPVNDSSSWNTTRAVAKILPDSSHHDAYVEKLDRFAEFAHSLDAGFWRWLGFGHPVPVIFRPFHEMTGSWFWWGGDNTTPDAFKRLWRFTVEYLRDEKDVHNLLYAYSPDVFADREEYLKYYPGDDYVDILGYDDYHSLTFGYEALAADTVDMSPQTADSIAAAALAEPLRTVAREADARGKIPAFTETGFEGIPDSTWWTDRLLRALKTDSLTRQTAYVLVWRNANRERYPGHHFAPYPGHASADNFVRFREDSLVRFEDDLPDLYDMP